MNHSAPGSPVEILLVEDNIDDARLTRELLVEGKLRNNLTVMEDGVKAMAYLRGMGEYQNRKLPDIVFLDLNLPKKDGREVLAEIKSDLKLKHIPVIILTASRAEEDILKAYNLNVTSYIIKPVSVEKFVRALRNLEGFWLSVVKLPGMNKPMSNTAVNVLLIENELPQAELLHKVLAKTTEPHFNLLFHNTLKEGLQRLASDEVHLILLDLGLEPECTGYDTFERVQAAAGDIPIIVLSGNDDEELAIQTVKNGAQDYLVKGHDDNPHWLLRSMHYALERKRAQQDLKIAYEEMERRVFERTAELREANGELEREIGDRRRAEEALLEANHRLAETLKELRETQQQIIQQERMHALGRMASGIAHDFNNALAPILGFSELLLIRPEMLDDRERTRSYLQMINTAAKDSATVVGRLREFYRYREQAEPDLPVVLNDLVQQVILLTQPKWKDQALAVGVSVKIKTDFKNTPTISGNESELREMLTNIVFNAVDAVVEQKGGWITFRTFEKGDSVVLQIIDTGAGMPEEVRLRCLEPFFSTKSEHGTGLGLGIVYGIVRRHGGKIDIESQVGEGTTVTITLPIHEDETVPEPEVWDGAGKINKRILVVEDEPLVREVISVYLSTDKHAVTTAVNGADGLEKYRAGTFDIVLTDRAMPHMNGDQLAESIKEIDPDMPVILLTGFGDIMIGAGEKPSGVDMILSKPFTMNQLRDAIGKFVRS